MGWGTAFVIVGALVAVLALGLVWWSERSQRLAEQERYRREHAVCGCGRASARVPHDLVVTAPPGYGYVHSPCKGVRVPGFVVPFRQGAEESRRMRSADRAYFDRRR